MKRLICHIGYPRPCGSDVISLGQYRWNPVPHSDQDLTWLTGMRTMTTAGDVNTQIGMATHIYLATESMVDSYFFSADSEMLVIPKKGISGSVPNWGLLTSSPRKSRSFQEVCYIGLKC